jgi:type 1 glutamine amidotransferase
MLGKILSQHHGFHCTVLFAIDPATGIIDPNNQTNIPGTATLRDADLMIIATRFRQLPPEQLQPFADFLNAGKPVIGLRTATHAFTGGAKTGDFKWAQFGLKILGEQWVAHHGRHKVEGARGVIEPANAAHPVLNGVKDVFALSDVYTVKNLTGTETLLMRAAVTETLDPRSRTLAEDPRNNPLQAAAWLKDYTAPDGVTQGKSFCTTMGAANDLTNADLRRMIVNAAYHLTGLNVPTMAKVDFVDPYEPTMFNFNKGDYWLKRGLKPADFALGKSAQSGVSTEPPPIPKKNEGKKKAAAN